MGIIQYAYDTDRLTYDYMDMEQQDTGSVSFSVVRDSETVNKITQMPRIKIDTSAKLQSSYQSFQNIYNSWQGIWGNAADYGITSPDDYYYIVWQVRNSVNATQPYTITQNVSVSGTNGAVSVVGARFGNENYSASLTSAMLRLSSENVYTYIITKHLKSAYPSDMSYRIESNVTTVIEPYDGLDSSSSQVTTSFRSYNPPTPVYPIGYFNFWKYNSYSDRKNTGVVNYQLTNFYNNQIDSITSNMNFHMYVHGYAYPWTIEDGYSTTDVSHYGKKKVTYELTDDEFYFNDNISDTSAPSGTEQLDINDFEIMSLKYTLLFQSAEWDERALKFVLCNPEYTSEEKVYFYAKFGEDETWKEIGVYHLDTGLCQIIDREKVQSWNGDSIIFNDDAGCVGFKIVSSNAFYYTRIDAYPYCRIKHSVRIDSMVSEKYRNNEKKSWFTNRANAKVYANDGEEISEENQIFNKTEVATNYLMGYDIESRINKNISFSQNDKLRHFVTLGWKVDLSESYKTQYGKKNVPQSSGTFYDLLPAGSTIDKSTVEVKANNEYLKESRYSVSTVINYKNSGRTLLIVKIDEGTESGYELTYSTIHSWDSIIDFGSRIHNSVAYETGNDSIAKGFPDDGGNIEDSSIMSDLDSDSDSERFVYAEHNYMMNILVAATNGLSKSVKNHNDYSYSREAVVYQNEQYEYKLRYANSYISVANNLVFYDSLESFSGDEGLASLWRGTLQSVDLSQAVLAGTAPVVYLSGSVLDMNDPDNRNLSDRSKWKPMEEFGDISAARSVAVDLSKNTSGGKFVLKENKSLSVELIMKAPPREPDDLGGTGNSCIQSLNGVYVSGNLINTETGVEEDGRLINWNYTAVELRIASDIPLKKVDESDHTKAVEGISFRLSGESDYGTYVDEIKESGINGYLTFAGIEKGEYTLTEESGSPDYQRITTYFSVKVNGQGEVYVDGQKISDGKRFIIADPPRIHTNVSFTKKDLSNKSKILHGVRFRLYGTSDYNNYVNMYADSDDKGVVEFKGIELGTYTLEEISSIDGYIIDPELHTVIIDENANFSISGSYMEKNGSLTLYNEPLHSFTLKKESYTKTGDVYNPVSGAVFRLHGVSDYGTSVDFQKTTHTNGKAYFTNLEAGKSYIIEEVSAPEGYIKDDEKRIVKIDPDGTITISGIEKNSSGEFVFKNRENGSVTVIKKWIDDKTNETRTAEPVINIGIDHKDPNAYFGDSSSSSVLSNVAALSNIRRFEPYKGDEADVQPLITNGTAKKIDDGTTENSIYAWFDASANGGTVYWWSDAAEVFLLDKSARLFRGLSDVTYIDVSGINTSECKNMSYMFNELKKLETIDGLDTWDVSSVTTMYNMFYNCQALMSLDLRGWDTSNVTSMYQMFYNCNSLTSIEGIDQWDVSKVTSMGYLFYRCYVLPTLDLSGWNVSSVTNMKSMFSSCSSMTSFDSISGWDVSLVKDMSSMFYGCSGITNFDILGGWDVSSVNSLNSVFSYCRNLTEIKGISDWNVSKANQTGYMFRGCEKLETLDLSKWKNKPQYAPNYMFQDCKMLEELDLSGFDFELAQNGMEYMFSGCSSLKKIEGLSNLNIPKVSSIKYMFSDCQNLISLDLSGWNAPNTTIMTNLFYNCKSLKSVDLTGWSFSKTSLEGLFLNCSSLETLDLSSWDTSKVTSTYRMFSNCSSLTTIYASDRWDLSSVTSSNNMFQNCTSLVGGNNTPYSSSNTGKAYAIIDEEGKPGYLTRKDYSPESEITIIELDESGTGTETGTEAEVRRILTKTTDDTWTYLFTGLDPTLNYCVWEDELEGYTSENMGMSNALSVRNNTATITNDSGYVPPVISYGSLKLKETIVIRHNGEIVQTPDMLKTFLFTVSLRDENGAVPADKMFDVLLTQNRETNNSQIVMTDGTLRIRLGNNESVTIADIPENYTYTVEQTVEDGFDMEITEGTETGTITANAVKTVGIVNSKETEDVTFRLQKVVTGNYIDPDEKFGFEITVSGLNANGIYEVTSDLRQTTEYLTASAAGTAYMKAELVDGETLSFTVPKNAVYTVLETAGEYISSYQITDNNGLDLISRSSDYNARKNMELSTLPETADSGEDILIVFTNLKDIRQDLTVTKKLVNASEDNTDLFSFTATITGLKAREVLNSSLGRLTADSDGKLSVSFQMAGGDSTVVYGIPVGAGYEVFEDRSEYIASYSIYDGSDEIFSGANDVPYKSLTTGTKQIQCDVDPLVVFSNAKTSCDVTVTKIINVSDPASETKYETDEFYFDVMIHGLNTANRKYSEFIVEYTDLKTTGVVRKTLADVLGLNEAQADETAADAVFTIMLRHGESIKIRSLPENATVFVTEQANVSYKLAYTVKANEDAVLQTEARSNDKKNKALSLSAKETIDESDRDIRFVFTATNDLSPYTLPETGREDQRPLMVVLLSGMMICGIMYWLVHRKRSVKH